MRGVQLEQLFATTVAWVLIASASVTVAQKVSVVRPVNGERLQSREVVFEIHTSHVSISEQGKVEVYVNDIRAFESVQPVISVRAPLEAGFHQVQAFLVDGAGARTGVQTEAVHFLVDYHDTPETGIADSGGWAGGMMPVEAGRVSVVIASHDRYELLMDSIESVKRQTYEEIEIIVVNDASRDPRYYALIEDVMMIHLPYNLGRPGLVRNVGIAASSGEFIAFLDDDDVWLPHKLQTQLLAMRARNASMSCTDALAGNGSYADGGQYKRWLRDYHGPYAVSKAMEAALKFGHQYDTTAAVEDGHCENAAFCLPDVWDWSVLVRANFVITTSVLARRELLFAAGPFNNKTLGEDHDMWKKCLRLSPLVFVRDPLVYWRVDSPDKLTQSHKE